MDGWCSFFLIRFLLSFFSSLGASLIIGFQSNQLGGRFMKNETFFLLKLKKQTVLSPLARKKEGISTKGGKMDRTWDIIIGSQFRRSLCLRIKIKIFYDYLCCAPASQLTFSVGPIPYYRLFEFTKWASDSPVSKSMDYSRTSLSRNPLNRTKSMAALNCHTIHPVEP